MSDWSKNNLACTTTWTALMVLEQLHEVFKKSGTILMKNLAYWNNTASGDTRNIQAASLARQTDNVFIKLRGAKYEAGTSQEKAVGDMVKTFTDETKTVSDLAAINDKNYLFLGEPHES